MAEREIQFLGGGLCVSLVGDGTGGSVSSDLHYASLEEYLGDGEDEGPLQNQFDYGCYEGAIDAVESLVLACAQAGVDVESQNFRTALQTTLDAIGNNL